MKYFFSHITQWSLPVSILLLVAAVAMWVPAFLTQEWYLVLTTLVLALCVSALLRRMLVQGGIIHYSNLMPIVLYILILTTQTSLTTCWQGQLAALVMVTAWMMMGRDTRQTDWVATSFWITLPLMLLSLLIPHTIWFVPCIWFGWISLRQFSLRSFSASLLAIALVSIYLFVAIFHQVTVCPYTDTIRLQVVSSLSPILLPLALGLVHLVWSFVYTQDESLRQHQSRLQLTWLYLVAVAIYLIFSLDVLLPVALVFLTAISAIVFTQQESVPRGVCFLLFVLMLVGLGLWPTILG